MSQINRTPTRGRNILDLILTDDLLIISSFAIGMPLGTSDHDSISVVLTLDREVMTNSKSSDLVTDNCELPLVYIWGKADWSGFNNACFET